LVQHPSWNIGHLMQNMLCDRRMSRIWATLSQIQVTNARSAFGPTKATLRLPGRIMLNIVIIEMTREFLRWTPWDARFNSVLYLDVFCGIWILKKITRSELVDRSLL
jgi:hypothetical protein